MEFTGTVDERMLDKLRDAIIIRLDIDGGDKYFTLHSHFDQMLEIGAMIVSVTRPSHVMIVAINHENCERVIMFNPSNGDWHIEDDDWVTIDETPSKVILEICDPTSESLWRAVSKYNLKVTFDGGSYSDNTEFRGTRDALERFIREDYEPETPEEYIRDIRTV